MLTRNAQKRDILDSRHCERRMDFIGDHRHTVRICQRRNPYKLVGGPNASNGIVRTAEQIRLRTSSECALERIEVDIPSATGRTYQRNFDKAPSRCTNDLKKWRVHRRVDHDAGICISEGAQAFRNAGHDVRHRKRGAWFHPPIETLAHEAPKRRAEFVYRSVSAVAELDGAVQYFFNRRCKRKIHFGNERGKHIRRVRRPLFAFALP